MAKKKSSSSKKNKSRKSNGAAGSNSPKKPVPVEEVISQAESAMEQNDVDNALKLFNYASGVLRTRVHAPTDVDVSGNNATAMQNNDNEQDKKMLSAVLGKTGELKASNGDVEGARTAFLDAIELLSTETNTMAMEEGECNLGVAQSCESRAQLHLYLGQLSQCTEALASFKLGVTELERAVSVLERLCAAGDGMSDMDMEGSEEMSMADMKRLLVETRQQLCLAHCSIAELYLTDLCEEPDAESSCEEALKSAVALDEVSSADATMDIGNEDGKMGAPQPDALQTMANFRLSQSRVPEALECILKAYDRMKVGCEAMSALVGLATDGKGNDVELESKSRELVDVEAASSLPEYNFRCQTAKIMLECASLLATESSGKEEMVNQCAESAIQVLGSLLAENDEVIEVWYLLGCAFMACSPPNPESAHHYWENALTMLTRAKEGLEQMVGDDEDDDDGIENELEAIECQIIDVQKKLGNYEEEEEDEEDDDMEDS